MAGWRDRSLIDLLAAHGLDLLPERDFPNDGWSGATFSSLEDTSGRRFVLKRTSLERDWIARATLDHELREGWVAAEAPWLASGAVPYLGAAADGDGVAILMPDLSAELIAWERPGHDPAIDDEGLTRVLNGIAWLHALVTGVDGMTERGGGVPWCPLPERLSLLTPSAAARYAAEENPVGERFLAGWAAFRRHAPDDGRALIDDLDRDVSLLVRALGSLPPIGLHGDLKLANVALLPEDAVVFIDWQMTLTAPLAVEMGWFLVSNSGALPVAPDRVLERYRFALGLQGGSAPDLIGAWDAQVDLTWIVGLLLRGWRKGLDAEAGVMLPSGMTAADDLAWWCERAVEAARRRL